MTVLHDPTLGQPTRTSGSLEETCRLCRRVWHSPEVGPREIGMDNQTMQPLDCSLFEPRVTDPARLARLRVAGDTDPWFELIAHRPTDTVAVLQIAGRIDSQTAPRLDAAIEEQLRSATQLLVLDLRGVVFFSVSGWRAVMRARAAAGRVCTGLRLVCHHRPVGQTLTRLDLTGSLDVHPDLEHALADADVAARCPRPLKLTGLTRPQAGTDAVVARAVSNRVHIAVVRYLEAVANALNYRAVAVSGVETTTAAEGVFGGRLGLGRKCVRPGSPAEVVELLWTEITGWEFALRPHRDRPRIQWRFLHDGLAPSPHHVAAFTHARLRGADVGKPDARQFGSPDCDLQALVRLLETAASEPRPAYLARVSYPPR